MSIQPIAWECDCGGIVPVENIVCSACGKLRSLPPPTEELTVGVRCGNCGGNVFMATCDNFRGTGHEWVLVGICTLCRQTHWTDDGCFDCKEPTDTERDRTDYEAFGG